MMAGSGSGSAVAGGLARHIPVLGRRAVEYLDVRDGGIYLDTTFGAGGYSRAILDAARCKVIAIDRDPGALAQAADLSAASDGRFVLGLGAGWHKPEYDQFGFPVDHRVSRFEEAISIIAPMLREGRANFEGTYYQVNDIVNQPRGPRGAEGGPPILIGTGSPRMLRLAARFADAWNGDWHREASAAVPLLERLDEACAEVGRDPASIVRTASSAIAMPGYLGVRANPITGESEQIAEALVGFRNLGLKHHVAGLDPCTPKSVEQFSRVVELMDRAS